MKKLDAGRWSRLRTWHSPRRGMRVLLLGTCACCLFPPNANTQDAPLPSPEAAGSAAPSSQPAITPPPPIIDPSLLALPDEKEPPRPDVPEIPALDDAFKPAPLSAAAEEQRQHLEWRRLRNVVQNNRDLQEALSAATAATTDQEKRKLLGRYYDLSYDRMMAHAAPDMQKYLLARKREAIGLLPQPRVRPDLIVSKTAGVTPSPTAIPKRTPVFSAPGAKRLGP
ncbi:MAG: hypothetical protein ABI946_11480 [Chthoniobacterales bacterium]